MLDLLPNKMNKLCEKKKYGVNLCFKSFEVSFYFTADDTTLGKVKSFFFKFSSASCISCCVGGTSRHF